MSKKLLKVISVILAIVMVTSTFTVVMAAEDTTVNAPVAEDTTVTDAKETVSGAIDVIQSVVNLDTETFASIKTLLLDYLNGFSNRHAQPENQWIVTLNGKEMDVLSFSGFTEAILNISTTQELKYVALSVVESLAHKILGALADTLSDPSYFQDEKNYKSENFYAGTEKFLDKPAENAKWPSYFRRQFVAFLQTVHNLS